MEAVEVVKENMQPRRGGRAAATLLAAEAGPEHAARVQAERSAFDAELAAGGGADPLAVWVRYAAWSQATFPEGGPAGGLLETLEAATRALDAARYANDPRYLRLWVQYADLCPEPKEIFDYLEHHAIGQGFALFYEARATFLELRGAFAAADSAFTTGIARSAQPLPRLRSKHAAFEARMVLRLKRKAADEALGISVVDDPPAREALALASAPAFLPTQRSRPAQVAAAGQLAVFEDGGASPAGNRRLGWGTLGTQAELRKENTQAATAWNTVRLAPAAGPSRSAAAADLEVYCDDPEEPAAIAASPAPRTSALRPRLANDPTSIAEVLCLSAQRNVVSDPRRRRERALLSPSGDTPAAKAAAHAAALASPAARGGGGLAMRSLDEAADGMEEEMSPPHHLATIPESRRPWDEAALLALSVSLAACRASGEASAEEHRAAFWVSRAREAAAARPAMPMVEPPVEIAPAAEASAVMLPAADEEMPHVAAPEPVAVLAVALPAPAISLHLARSVPNDDAAMTVNLRDAYSDIMSMFADALPPLPGRRRAAGGAGPSEAVGARPAPLLEVFEEGSPGGSPSAGGLEVYQDATIDLPPMAPVRPPAALPFLPIFEDAAEAAPDEQPAPQHPPAEQLPADAEGEDYFSDGENDNPEPSAPAAAGPGPALQVMGEWPETELAGLRGQEDLDEAAAAARAAALAALALPAAIEEEGFVVYEEGAQAAPGAQALAYEPSCLVEPFTAAAVATALASLEEPVDTLPGFTSEPEAAASSLEAALSAARRRPRAATPLLLGGFTYLLGALCGRGAAADIYEAVDEDDVGTDAPPPLALKVVRPPDAAASAWEFAVMRRVAGRVPPAERSRFLIAQRLHTAGPIAVLVAPFSPHGTLQDAVNAALAAAAGTPGALALPEPLAMFFTVELLRTLDVLHAAGFLHGDIKPDNILLRGLDAPVSAEWAPGRGGGWDRRGLTLCDFGRAVDLSLLPPGAACVGDCNTENFRCPEMLTGRPWTAQADSFGLLGCAHALLWGSYLELATDPATGRFRRVAPLKRYWHAPLWEPLFDDLLNVPSCGALPSLAAHAAAFEEFLAEPSRARLVRQQLGDLVVSMAGLAAKAAASKA